MVKRRYTSPMMLMIEPEDDPIIVIGGSQGSSGYDSSYTFSGISQDDLDMIELNCDDFDLQDMDTNGNYEITLAEFQAWLDARGGW